MVLRMPTLRRMLPTLLSFVYTNSVSGHRKLSRTNRSEQASAVSSITSSITIFERWLLRPRDTMRSKLSPFNLANFDWR